MKNYTITTLVVLLLSASGFAEQAQSSFTGTTTSAPVSLNSGSIDNIRSSTNTIVETTSTDAAYNNFRTAFTNAGVNPNELNSTGNGVASINSPAGVRNYFPRVRDAAKQCVDYVEQANQCCTQPETCGGSGGNNFRGMIQGAAQIAPLIAQLTGAGVAASCLQALPGLVDGLSFSRGMSKACQMLRNGANATDAQNGQSAGCIEICSVSREIINLYSDKVQAEISKGETGLNTYISQINQINSEVSRSQNRCSSSLAQAEAEADAQSASNQQTQNSAMQCAEDFMNEDDEVAEEEQTPNIQDPAYNDLALGGDGAREKLGTDNSFMDTVDGSEDDDLLPDDPRAPAGGGAGQKAGGQGMMGGMGGGMGGGGLGGGGSANENPSEKTTGGARKKSDSLISGYAKSKGGSGSSGAGGSKKFGNFFKKAKDAKNADKNGALAGLSKLVKAGISPNTSGSIFERVTQRFVASSAKENMFDAKTNKKLWMNKK